MDSEASKSDSQTRPARKRVDPFVGTVLDGRFEIEEVLGSGGMSVVYKANQLRVNRHVAVKTLRMQLDSKPIYRERFQNEINLLCALSHPNIVTVYDCVIGPDDQPYVIMDYLRGRSLEVLIGQEGPISVERFLRIAVQVCGALDHAHRKGVIHRDLKPGNIVLMDDESDFVKVVDFGLAKLNDTNRRLTQSGELWGSPPYMSPEHCQSKPEDERSDLYSFGCVMYEMLTGKDPFHFATSVYELIQIHINTQAPSLAEANPLVHVPAELEAVIFKAMAKLPEDRYQTAAELRDALVTVSSRLGNKHSGDLLALPNAGSRSNSTGEIVPAPGAANFSPAGAPSTSPSEHFRRALDPMRGINVDELFDGTADSAELSNQSRSTPSNQSKTAQTDLNASTAAPALRAMDSSTMPGKPAQPHAGSSVRKLQSQGNRSIAIPIIAAALGGATIVALAIFVLPGILHPPSPGKAIPDAVSTQEHAGTAASAGGAASAASTTSAATTIPVGNSTPVSTPAQSTQSPATVHSSGAPVPTAATHQTAPTHQATATTHTPVATHAAASNHAPAARAGIARASSSHIVSAPHKPTTVHASSHPASSAKSLNPWDAMQRLRKGK